MINSTNQLALDARGLDDLKRASRDAPDQALKTVATQFEALFMNMLMKNMRDSIPKDGLLASSAGETYTGMLDQQLSQKLASKGTGLSEMLVKQLSRNIKPAAGAVTEAIHPAPVNPKISGVENARAGFQNNLLNKSKSTLSGTGTTPAVLQTPPVAQRQSAAAGVAGAGAGPVTSVPAQKTAALNAAAINPADRKREFVSKMAAHAKAAEIKTGVPAKFMIGQAALESGWGKKEIKDSSGQPAFNLFGVKATGKWDGPTVDVTTTEFVNGVAKKVVEKFRAYASYAEGFADYAKLMANSPRYANVLKTAGQGIEAFAQGLQRAGYATDPGYATKLTKVIHDAVKIDLQA